MAIYIEEIISEKTENQNELYFLAIWNSTSGGLPIRQEVQFFVYLKSLQIIYDYFTIYYLEIYTKFSTHPFNILN